MYLELGLAAGTVMAATLVVRRWIRRRRARKIDGGLVSGSWLAEQKMNKQNTNWP